MYSQKRMAAAQRKRNDRSFGGTDWARSAMKSCSPGIKFVKRRTGTRASYFSTRPHFRLIDNRTYSKSGAPSEGSVVSLAMVLASCGHTLAALRFRLRYLYVPITRPDQALLPPFREAIFARFY